MGKQAFRLPGTLLPSAYAQLTGERAGALAEHIAQEDGTSHRKTRSMCWNNSVAITRKVTSFYSIFVLGANLTTGLKDWSAALQCAGSRSYQPEANTNVVFTCTEADSTERHHAYAQVDALLPGFFKSVVR